MDLSELWVFIEADLARARNTLPEDALKHEAVRNYQEFLDHNELELACDMLEAYANEHPVKNEFWLALSDAATRVELPSATRYGANARNLEYN
jgi:hypothetical protein